MGNKHSTCGAGAGGAAEAPSLPAILDKLVASHDLQINAQSRRPIGATPTHEASS